MYRVRVCVLPSLSVYVSVPSGTEWCSVRVNGLCTACFVSARPRMMRRLLRRDTMSGLRFCSTTLSKSWAASHVVRHKHDVQPLCVVVYLLIQHVHVIGVIVGEHNLKRERIDVPAAHSAGGHHLDAEQRCVAAALTSCRTWSCYRGARPTGCHQSIRRHPPDWTRPSGTAASAQDCAPTPGSMRQHGACQRRKRASSEMQTALGLRGCVQAEPRASTIRSRRVWQGRCSTNRQYRPTCKCSQRASSRMHATHGACIRAPSPRQGRFCGPDHSR